MKKLTGLLLILFLLGIPSISGAPPPPVSSINVTEGDGVPSPWVYKLIFPNGTVTDNGNGTVTIITEPGGVFTFLGAADTPASYLGKAGNFVKVNTGETAVEFTAATISEHTILDSTVHTDALTGTVLRGDVIIGNSTPKWSRLVKGTSGAFLTVNATDTFWSTYFLSGTAAATYTFPAATASIARTDAGQTFTGVQVFTAPTVATSITPNTFANASLGTSLLPFSSVFIGDAATNNIQLINTDASSAKVATFPDVTGTVVVATASATATQALFATTTSGAPAYRAIASADLPATITGLTSVSSTGFSGALTGNADTATASGTSTIVNATTAATMYPVWVTANTGNLPLKTTSAGLSFRPDTGILTATGFSGPLTGNVTGNVSGTAATVTGSTQASITSAANLVTVGALSTGSLASGFTPVTVPLGGTGASTYALNGVLYGNAANAIGVTAIGGEGQILRVGASPFVPAWTTATWPATIADGSILATNAANIMSAITWHTAGTKVLTNASGTISWEDAAAPGVHAIVGASHTLTGATAGTILRATAADAFGWTTSTWVDAYAIGSIPHATTAANTMTALLPGAVGSFLMSNGTGANLSYLAPGAATYILVGAGVTSIPVWTAPTGTGSPVLGTSPTFTTQLTTPKIASAGGLTIDAVNAAANTTVAIGNSAATYVANVTVDGDITITGLLKTGTGPTTLTDAAGKILAASLNTVGVPQGGTGLTTVTANSYLKGNGTSALVERTYAEVKTDLSLNNVENTALTTWTGAATIATVGTITSGVWSGTAITVPKGGTGITSGTSGGIPYYSGTTTMATSTLLAQYGVVLGGGAGATPYTITPSTTTTYALFATATAPAFRAIAAADLPGGLGSISGLTETNGGIPYGTSDNNYAWLAAGGAGKLLMGAGAGAPVWTTPTYPNAATTGGAYIRADGTNFIMSTLVLPNSATAYKLAAYTATNTLTELVAVGATGTILTGVTGAIPVWTTATYPATTTAYQLLVSTATSVVGGLTAGTDGQLLRGVTGAVPAWTTVTFPSTVAIGSVLVANTANIMTALASTSGTYYLKNLDGVLSWGIPSGAGDVVGPASSTDNAITRFDSTTGKLLQNSVVIVDDTGNMSGIGTISAGATGFTVDADGDTVAKSVTVTKASGVAGEVQIYNDYLTQTYGVILKGPTGTMGSAYILQYPNAIPTTGQVAAYGTPLTWILPALSPTGYQVTFSGPSAAHTYALPNADATILTNNTAVSVGQGGTGLTTGTSGGVPYFNATNTMASSPALAQYNIVLGGGAGAAPVTLGSIGTTTTVLHGNAIGAPSFGAVVLTTDVSGVLPIANGGSAKAITLAAGGVIWGDADSFEITAAGSAGQLFVSTGTTAPAWTTATYPTTATGTGTILRAGGTNWGATTSTFTDTYVQGGILHAATANTIAALAPGAIGSFLMSNGASAALSYLAAGAANYVLVGAGTTTIPVWTASTGTGAPVLATAPTFVTSVALPATLSSATAVTWTLMDNQASGLSFGATGAADILKIGTLDAGVGVTVTGFLTTTGLLTAGTISAGAAGFSVDADGDVIGKSFTSTKANGVAGTNLLYEATTTETNGVGWKGPASRASDLYLQFSNSDPAINQFMLFPAPTTGTSTAVWTTYGQFESLAILTSGTLGAGATTVTSLNGHTFTTGSSVFTGTAGQTYTFPTTTQYLAPNPLTTIGDLPYASSTATPATYGRIAAVATGSVLASAGTGTVPAWSSSPAISPSAFVITSQAIGDLLYASSTTAWARLGIQAAGYILVGGTTPGWSATPAIGAATATSLIATGIVDGLTNVTIWTTGAITANPTGKMSQIIVNKHATPATAFPVTMSVPIAGMQLIVKNGQGSGGANTGVITLTAGTNVIIRNPTTKLDCTATQNLVSGGTPGDYVALVAMDSLHWESVGYQGTWACATP